MKQSTNFKRVLSGMLSAILTVSTIPIASAFAEESMEPYPYTLFAASGEDGAITVNAGNFCINGNVATNGTIVSSGNMNINGTRTEHADESMLYVLKKLNYSYFSGENVTFYTDDYIYEDLNININNPIDVNGTISLTGNINLNSGIKAVDNITINGEVKNANNAVICSETGDINIDTSNVSFNGLIYAPYGDIVIESDNLNLNNVVIIGQTITIDCPNVNANYNTSMGSLIGNTSEMDVELYAMGNYNADENVIDIEWFTNYTNGSFEVLCSEDNENYSPVAEVTDASAYQYSITDDFEKMYFKVSLTTSYNETIESIPFVVNRDAEGYAVEFLDSDEDTLPDVLEISIGTNPYVADTDEDGLTDYQEYLISGTDPLIYDSITEGIADAFADTDEDGICNIDEINADTNPLSPDTDDDGLSDYDELNVYGTDPRMPDSDNDAVEDGSEIKLGLNPCNPETFGVPDNEYKVFQTIATDSPMLSSINTEDSPYEFSVDIKTNLDAEKEISVVKSGYSAVIQNDAMIGASLDISISEACNPENIVIRYNVKEAFRENTLNLYSEYEEFSGLKRLNIFRFNEETNMLLPIDTEFDIESGTVFAEVEELGTYCIMDMEIWLNHLDVKLNTPEIDEQGQDFSPKYAPKRATKKSGASGNWKPTYVQAPVDLVFVLQTAGHDSNAFLTEENIMKSFSLYVLEKYEDVRIYIVGFNKSSAKYVKADQMLSRNYLTSYSEVVNALETVTYSGSEYDYCDRGQAYQKLFEDHFFREDADKFIYNFVNGNTKSYTNYDQIDIIDNNLGMYSEVFPKNWHYIEKDFGDEVKTKITEKENLFISLSEKTYSLLTEHFDKKVSQKRLKYTIILPTNWKTITLEDELSSDNNIDTDKDGLTDWEEVDVEKLILNDDGSFDLPVITVNEILLNMSRFRAFEEYVPSDLTIHYLPVISDPTQKDSDGDGINDDEEIRPIVELSDDYYSNPLTIDSDGDGINDFTDPQPTKEDFWMDWESTWSNVNAEDYMKRRNVNELIFKCVHPLGAWYYHSCIIVFSNSNSKYYNDNAYDKKAEVQLASMYSQNWNNIRYVTFGAGPVEKDGKKYLIADFNRDRDKNLKIKTQMINLTTNPNVNSHIEDLIKNQQNYMTNANILYAPLLTKDTDKKNCHSYTAGLLAASKIDDLGYFIGFSECDIIFFYYCENNVPGYAYPVAAKYFEVI